MSSTATWIIGASLAGIVAGIFLLFRGFASRLTGTRIADTATSSIASIALGEVRVSGVVEPAEVLLASPLQDAACVYYRSRVSGRTVASGSGGFDGGPLGFGGSIGLGDLVDVDVPFGGDRDDWTEERAVGFRVRDASGSLRVFPRDARWDVPDCYDESSSLLGGSPPGLQFRSGSAYRPAHEGRDEQIAALLTVRQPAGIPSWADGAGWSSPGSRKLRYREARIEPGDVVTVIGRVVRFGDLPDPASADSASGAAGALIGPDDPVIAEARAAGILETDPAKAWGNAAIPGFGIGRPVREPALDPRATSAALATPDEQARFERTFDLAPDSLVLAVDNDAPLVVALGAPSAAVARHEGRYAVGLLGAVLAIGSAVVLALTLTRGFAT